MRSRLRGEQEIHFFIRFLLGSAFVVFSGTSVSMMDGGRTAVTQPDAGFVLSAAAPRADRLPIPVARPVDRMTTASIAPVGPRPIERINFARRADFDQERLTQSRLAHLAATRAAPPINPIASVETGLPEGHFVLAPRPDAASPAGFAVAAARPVAKPVNRPATLLAMVPQPNPLRLVSASPTDVVSAYANADGGRGVNDPFRAVLGAPPAKPGILGTARIVDDASHAWVNNPIPVSARSKSEQRCLAEAIYFEARGEPVKGQQAVAQVVINRLKNPAYPKTICGVVYQNKNMRNRCQFSFACDGKRDAIVPGPAWTTAQAVAEETVNDGTLAFLTDVGSSTHYHATYVRPRWARRMKVMERIGHHIFYKTKNGGWS